MKSILITGATGKQGGALINALLAEDADFNILAVTRNRDSPSAKHLAEKSPKIQLVEGNLDDPAGIFQTVQEISSEPVWGVFSVLTPTDGQNPETEEKQGKALIDEALRRNVQHFIYSSVDRGGAASHTNATNIPHFASKHRIEQHLFSSADADSRMSWTVLRPVFFLDNITADFSGQVTATAWDAYLQGKPLQCVAVSDVGYFAAQAFLNPAQYRDLALSVAGDELTYERMQGIVRRKTGQQVPTTFRMVCYAVLGAEMRAMWEWFYEHGYRVDIAGLREMYPRLKDLEAWLEEDSTLGK